MKRSLLPSGGACYGFRLTSCPASQDPPVSLSTRKCNPCLEHFSGKLFFLLLTLVFVQARVACAQAASHPAKADLPRNDEIRLSSVTQDSKPPWRYLKGTAKVETSEMAISADEIDYNSDTQWTYAKGHVHMEMFSTGDKLNAEHGEYNLKTEEGKFYAVDGTAPAKIISSPAVLSTTNPFYFKADWAERIKTRYILHKAFVTDCKYPKPWWTFEAPVFDVIPGDRAIGKHTLFRLRRVPILYLPYFKRPLGRNPRQSGFLTPNFGHSSVFGYIYGLGYYWAINRSYDMTGVAQYFTARGPAFSYDFRGKPNDVTDFNFSLYKVDDQQGAPGSHQNQGGTEFSLTARTQIFGFNGRLDWNYLSSFLFRQAFSYSFYSAVYSQISSIGYLQRRFDDDRYSLNIVFSRDQLFESATPLNQTPDQVIVQKLPSIEFSGRDQQIAGGPVPLWFSFSSSVGMLDRSQPTGYVPEAGGVPSAVFSSGPVGRLNLEPRVSTAFSFAGFSLSPAVTFGNTDYTNSFSENSTIFIPGSCGNFVSCSPNSISTVALAKTAYFRNDADVTFDFRLPAIERVYQPPKWLHLGQKLKHVAEIEAEYEYVTGINAFQKIIQFDETDILSNTNQLTYYLTNRLYRKDKNGNVDEILTWRVGQAQYFDPTFGGAVLPNTRNVIWASEELTAFPFLTGPGRIRPLFRACSSILFRSYPLTGEPIMTPFTIAL